MLEKYISNRLKDRAILLMTHAVVGYPSLDDNWNMLECMQDVGIDLVELQLPFSEPIADGPAFIKANQIALEQGVHWREYFDFLEKAAEEFNFPLLFMGYYNSIFCMGHEIFCDTLISAGGSGFIVADLPVEQSTELDQLAKAKKLDHIQIMTPVDTDARMEQISHQASGFLYCVTRKGVTGKETDFNQDLFGYVKRCRAVTQLPLALGFGIKTAQQVSALSGIADIAIIGTAGLEVWENEGKMPYHKYLNELAQACL